MFGGGKGGMVREIAVEAHEAGARLGEEDHSPNQLPPSRQVLRQLHIPFGVQTGVERLHHAAQHPLGAQTLRLFPLRGLQGSRLLLDLERLDRRGRGREQNP